MAAQRVQRTLRHAGLLARRRRPGRLIVISSNPGRARAGSLQRLTHLRRRLVRQGVPREQRPQLAQAGAAVDLAAAAERARAPRLRRA